MILRIKAGDNPADPSQLRVYAGDEIVTNAIVAKAYWVGDGPDRVMISEVEIKQGGKVENHEHQERDLRAEVQRKSGPTTK